MAAYIIVPLACRGTHRQITASTTNTDAVIHAAACARVRARDVAAKHDGRWCLTARDAYADAP